LNLLRQILECGCICSINLGIDGINGFFGGLGFGCSFVAVFTCGDVRRLPDDVLFLPPEAEVGLVSILGWESLPIAVLGLHVTTLED
jgi:hypothetical protein